MYFGCELARLIDVSEASLPVWLTGFWAGWLLGWLAGWLATGGAHGEIRLADEDKLALINQFDWQLTNDGQDRIMVGRQSGRLTGCHLARQLCRPALGGWSGLAWLAGLVGLWLEAAAGWAARAA